MNNRILHGLEFELQLMAETEEGLKVVSAETYLDKQYNLLPSHVNFDFGNLEVATPPRETYKEAVESANYILDKKLVPALINDFKLEKFALFLPNPMCLLYYDIEPDCYTWNGKKIYRETKIRIIQPGEAVSCLKHWNISLNYDYTANSFPIDWEYTITKDWVYDYKSLVEKGYQVQVKDLGFKDTSRVHIKIPYHYAPLNGNPNLLPNFEDILLPPERGWGNIVCYYKDNIFTKVRNLI